MQSISAKLDIINSALGFLGTRSIASENENSQEAIWANHHWNNARRAALRDYPYPFSRARVKLALMSSLPEEYASQWQYAYGWPNNALRILEITNENKTAPPRRAPYILRNIDGIAQILCNVEGAYAEIIQDITSVSLWDDMFVANMARKLACLLAVPLLRNNTNKVQEVEQLYSAQLQAMRSQAAGDEWESPSEPDSWLLARGGFS